MRDQPTSGSSELEMDARQNGQLARDHILTTDAHRQKVAVAKPEIGGGFLGALIAFRLCAQRAFIGPTALAQQTIGS